MMYFEQLEQEFPELLRDAAWSDIPPGWIKLARALCHQLSVNHPDVRITQIKSKFGSLRCYVDGGTAEAYRLISEHEKQSATVCEQCGGVGTRTGTGWIMTLCVDCFQETQSGLLR